MANMVACWLNCELAVECNPSSSIELGSGKCPIPGIQLFLPVPGLFDNLGGFGFLHDLEASLFVQVV